MSDERKKPFGEQFNPRPDQILQPHESAVRSMVYGAHGIPYQPLHSLEEAKAFADGIVVMEGDDGGQIYLVCPASLVACNQETLEQLLRDLDGTKWNDLGMAHLFYERQPVGTGIAGGMGGGRVTGTLWVHNQFVQEQLDGLILNVLQGELSRLPEAIRSRQLGPWKRPKPEKHNNE